MHAIRSSICWLSLNTQTEKRLKKKKKRVGLFPLGTARRPMWLEPRKQEKSEGEGGKRGSDQVRGGGGSDQDDSSLKGERL